VCRIWGTQSGEYYIIGSVSICAVHQTLLVRAGFSCLKVRSKGEVLLTRWKVFEFYKISLISWPLGKGFVPWRKLVISSFCIGINWEGYKPSDNLQDDDYERWIGEDEGHPNARIQKNGEMCLSTYPGDFNFVKHWTRARSFTAMTTHETRACSCIHKNVNVLSVNIQAYKIMITLSYRFSTERHEERYYTRRTLPGKHGKGDAKSTVFARHRNTWVSEWKDECILFIWRIP
jgi:hypothetical protein